jgi:hypothetical protein
MARCVVCEKNFITEKISDLFNKGEIKNGRFICSNCLKNYKGVKFGIETKKCHKCNKLLIYASKRKYITIYCKKNKRITFPMCISCIIKNLSIPEDKLK